MKIGVLGELANDYANEFNKHTCLLLDRHEQIDSDFDVIFCVGYPRLIPHEYLDRVKHGVFVSHSTDLPLGRGWAPLQWSVLQGQQEITVTLFKAVDDGECDNGPWVFKKRFDIEPTNTLAILYEKDRIVSLNLFYKLIETLENDKLVLHNQTGIRTFNRRRKPEDSELDPSKTLTQLWNHIRVCDNDKYPAFFKINGTKVFLRYNVEPILPSSELGTKN